MDILQEIYYMFGDNKALGVLKNDKVLEKRERELEALKKDFLYKIDNNDKLPKEELEKAFGDILDAALSVSEEEQNIYFIEGFKMGVQFLLSCFEQRCKDMKKY